MFMAYHDCLPNNNFSPAQATPTIPFEIKWFSELSEHSEVELLLRVLRLPDWLTAWQIWKPAPRRAADGWLHRFTVSMTVRFRGFQDH